MWKTKEKQIGEHVPRGNSLITGRAPANTEMLFTPAELSEAWRSAPAERRLTSEPRGLELRCVSISSQDTCMTRTIVLRCWILYAP